MISRHTSLIARMLTQAAPAGSAAASITFRWMPLLNASVLPRSTSTPVSCATACRSPASSRRQCPAAIAPL